MKASDLRLGNQIFKIRLHPAPAKRTTLHGLDLVNFSVWGTGLQPILLTDAEYENFGFEWNQKHCYWKKGNFKILQWSDKAQYISTGSNDVDLEIEPSPGYIKIKKLQYVHELQNLYYAIIGEELTESGFKLTI